VVTKRKLAVEFENAIIDDYKKWRATLEKGDRSGVRYRGMITRFGAVGMMKRLLASLVNKRKREQFGVEQFVVLRRFQPLFTKAEIQEAKMRLKLMKG
jgi:hypothetical protein